MYDPSEHNGAPDPRCVIDIEVVNARELSVTVDTGGPLPEFVTVRGNADAVEYITRVLERDLDAHALPDADGTETDASETNTVNVTPSPATLDLEVLRHLRTCDAGAAVNDLCRGLCIPYSVIARCELAGWISISQDLMATLTNAGRKLLK